MSKARNFNGTTQRLTGASGYLVSAGVFTMMCWMKPNSITGTPQSILFINYKGSSDRSWRVQYGYTTATVELNDSNNASYITNSGLVIPDTNWHHVCYRQNTATYDKFLDGTKTVISASFGGQTLVFEGDAFYVAERSIFGNFFGGTIAEVALWSTALTDANIAAIATAAGATRPSDFAAGLVGYWPLGLGDPEPDQSGGGVSLTLTNAPTVVDGPYPPPNFGLPSSHAVPVLTIQQW